MPLAAAELLFSAVLAAVVAANQAVDLARLIFAETLQHDGVGPPRLALSLVAVVPRPAFHLRRPLQHLPQ